MGAPIYLVPPVFTEYVKIGCSEFGNELYIAYILNTDQCSLTPQMN
jgi:hypothetical protein